MKGWQYDAELCTSSQEIPVLPLQVGVQREQTLGLRKEGVSSLQTHLKLKTLVEELQDSGGLRFDIEKI
ncbi:hypothetical protein CHARACLAT_004021 [Characodon lateralis]|uniref:Uncharacterized protein n=1 Tax=Characodon lateralis TaxID=208331 RepID=A0ABU7F1D5_9TELE|nr:hypothetical protein [Characodon lateralis]